MSQGKAHSVVLSTGTLIRFVCVLLGFYLLFVLRDVALIVLASVVIASGLEPVTRWFERRKFPRVLAAIVVYACIVTFIVIMLLFFVPKLLEDAVGLIDQVLKYARQQHLIDTPAVRLPRVPEALTSQLVYLRDALGPFFSVAGSVGSGVVTTASTIFGGITNIVLMLVLAFYLSAQRNGVLNFLKIITPIKREPYVIDLWARSQRKIGLWVQGQLLLAVLIGLMTWAGLSLLGVERAFFLAVIAGTFELIPVFGPVLAALPGIAVALLSQGASFALVVAGLYFLIQQLENHVIHPLVVNKIVGIPPIIAILALIIGAKLAGIIGMVIAVPLSAALMEFINDLEKKRSEPV